MAIFADDGKLYLLGMYGIHVLIIYVYM
nr:unnamed protein product [Callosobruchus analis]